MSRANDRRRGIVVCKGEEMLGKSNLEIKRGKSVSFYLLVDK